MPEYKKVGYLTTDFKMFHLKDEEMRSFHYHYHDFHKIVVFLSGKVTYTRIRTAISVCVFKKLMKKSPMYCAFTPSETAG